jgi:hypothetical protein
MGRSAVASAAVLAAVATGCGIGPGESSEGEATLTVTRDYGADPVVSVSEQDPPATETVIRFLDRETEITTRYGGAFVQSIDGTSGSASDGRSSDWFFYVNGLWSDRGGADVAVRGGDRIWWDYRDWTDAMRVPAVVGSWPEPFAQASTGAADRLPVQVECFGPRPPCAEAAARLADEGIDAPVVAPGAAGEDRLRLLVGTWDRVREDPVATVIERGPSVSGVFADFEEFRGARRLLALDTRGGLVREHDSNAGLVAALRPNEDPVTWVVTGTDDAGVGAAVELLGDDLADRYAVVADGSGAAIALPAAQRAE